MCESDQIDIRPAMSPSWLVGLFFLGFVRGRRKSDVMLSILQVNWYMETMASLEAGNGDNASVPYCTVQYRFRYFRYRISLPEKYVSHA